MSGLTSNANLTGYRYGNVATVGEQFPNVPIQAAPTGGQTVTLNLLTNTSTVYNPTVVLGAVTISLNQIASTSVVYNPTVSPGAVTISLDTITSTSSVFNPTVIQPGGLQTITLDLLASTSQIFLPTITIASAITDTSDILSRGLKQLRKDEEQIAAQMLKARRKPSERASELKKQIDWKELLLRQINGADSIEELDAIEIAEPPKADPKLIKAILAEIELRKEARRAELQLQMAELELKMQETATAAQKIETEIATKLEEQRQAIETIQRTKQEIVARHNIAVEAARQAELQALLEFQEAERKAEEFNRKRDNRIKRLKALMWLAKLDL